MSVTNSRITWQCWQKETSLARSRPTALPSTMTGNGMMQIPMNSIH